MLGMIRRMNFDKMFASADKIAENEHKNKVFVLADMVWCGLRYGAGYSDYALFHMYKMDAKQRKSVLTRGKNNQYVHALNDPKEMHYFAQKSDFLRAFDPYIKRKWLDLRGENRGETRDAPGVGPGLDQDRPGGEPGENGGQTGGETGDRASMVKKLEAMTRELGVVLMKPQDATHGDGVEKFYAKDISDYPAFYDKLVKEGRTLVEEVITQHPDLDRLWPGSINTVRLVTIYAHGKGNIVASFLRVGNSDKPVDNFNGGGMVVPLDVETGKVLCAAVNKAGERFEVHPGTGTPFEGFVVPLWDQVIALAEEAAGVVKGVRYVGWDVAVTPEGPCLVEGNQYPGHDIYGLPGQTEEQMGVLPNFEKVLPMRDLPRR